MRFLELFSGIGGLAEAASEHTVVAAVDHDRRAQTVYAANFDHPQPIKNLVAVKPAWLAAFEADAWWLSPPCAPHSVRGNQRDLDDPRSSALRNLLAALPIVRPNVVFLENVPGFADSQAHAAFRDATAAAGLVHREEREICPTLLGIPGVRRRFYAVASREPLTVGAPPHHPVRLRDLLQAHDDPALEVPQEVVQRFGSAFHRVDPDDPQAVAACFTRAYTTSPVYAGSYLARPDDSVRYFAPEEIARLHGHRADFSFAGLPIGDRWKLVGNGLSVPVVRWVLSWANLA